jgi:hypothetical protein
VFERELLALRRLDYQFHTVETRKPRRGKLKLFALCPVHAKSAGVDYRNMVNHSRSATSVVYPYANRLARRLYFGRAPRTEPAGPPLPGCEAYAEDP